jgi:predicted deacylase
MTDEMTVQRLVLDGLPGPMVEIPYVDVRGMHDGPQLTVLAGVHGAEYASIAAARQFARQLDPHDVHGRIVIVPVVNVLGFWARAPFVVPVDGENLNRCFPGDPGGGYTQQLAHHITTTFIARADYVVDLHAGDIPESLEPFALYEESSVESASREMALAYGLGHVVRQSAALRTVAGSTCAAAADLGIPAIIAESGQNGLLDDLAVARHRSGLTNLARSIGVLAGKTEAQPIPREYDGWHWLRTPVSGWWEPAVSLGVQVNAGEILGTVSDLCGGVVAEIRAPERGVPLFFTSSPAVVEEGLVMGLARPQVRP